jgi:hypothetical protein
MALSDSDIEAVAARVAELLAVGRTGGEFVDAAEIARRFSVSRDFVYSHAEELGAVRLGTGPKARLRFDPAGVGDYLKGGAAKPARPIPQRRRSLQGSTLLPVRKRTER